MKNENAKSKVPFGVVRCIIDFVFLDKKVFLGKNDAAKIAYFKNQKEKCFCEFFTV